MLQTITDRGVFYQTLLNKNNYDEKMQDCIKKTVANLLDRTTTFDRPGMLLGKIQSGKTRTFLGVMGLAFDNGYEVAIVLTKGTKALAQQTLERLKKEYAELMEADKIQIFDIMHFPKNLTGFELEQKLVLVVKKEIQNMNRLHEAFFQTYPSLKEKKILIVDDEADFASIGFNKTRREGTEIKKIAGSIDEFRKKVTRSSYLQVTATPYSLYLQPEDLVLDSRNLVFKPIKPSFTVLVPVHDKYIGGDYYFGQSEENSIAYHLYEPVDEDELRILKKQDRRSFKLEESLTSQKVKSLRHSIVNFIVGGCIRRLQDRKQGLNEKKFSFIIHTEQNKAAHNWQENIIFSIKEQLAEAAAQNNALFDQLLRESYNNLHKSMVLHSSLEIPDYETVKNEVRHSLQKDYIMITVVNSEKDVNELLDDSGQLKLRTPLNIFIGGQILDRGITIGNLIGFYYGRRPQTFQQDTVLQHSRMYGARPIEDLAVTRFYTTPDIYDVMKRIHEFDTALREAFEKGDHDSGVVFIQKDTQNRIIPCSPNKILLSSTTTLKPSIRMLPIGFKVKAKTHLKKPVSDIDRLIEAYAPGDASKAFLMPVNDAMKLIESVADTFEEGHGWDVRAYLASLEYLCNQTTNEELKGKVWVLVRKGREAKRLKQDGRFENSPDSYQEKGKARELAQEIPALIMLRQNGEEANGWTGHPFWWPVLVTPRNTKTVVFTSEQVGVEE